MSLSPPHSLLSETGVGRSPNLKVKTKNHSIPHGRAFHVKPSVTPIIALKVYPKVTPIRAILFPRNFLGNPSGPSVKIAQKFTKKPLVILAEVCVTLDLSGLFAQHCEKHLPENKNTRK
jgi:hypothetical protein